MEGFVLVQDSTTNGQVRSASFQIGVGFNLIWFWDGVGVEGGSWRSGSETGSGFGAGEDLVFLSFFVALIFFIVWLLWLVGRVIIIPI